MKNGAAFSGTLGDKCSLNVLIPYEVGSFASSFAQRTHATSMTSISAIRIIKDGSDQLLFIAQRTTGATATMATKLNTNNLVESGLSTVLHALQVIGV